MKSCVSRETALSSAAFDGFSSTLALLRAVEARAPTVQRLPTDQASEFPRETRRAWCFRNSHVEGGQSSRMCGGKPDAIRLSYSAAAARHVIRTCLPRSSSERPRNRWLSPAFARINLSCSCSGTLISEFHQACAEPVDSPRPASSILHRILHPRLFKPLHPQPARITAATRMPLRIRVVATVRQ